MAHQLYNEIYVRKRSKEFGTYQILGIEKKDISKMFTLENLVIGVVAFVVGIFAGTFLYQVFSSIIMNLFNQPYEIQLTFNIKAVGITAAYFFGIFVLVLLNCRRKIKKTKVYDLLYADKKNENNIIKKSKGNIVVFIISLILLSVALLINHRAFTNADNAGRDIFTAIILLIVGIYLFYISFSCFIVKRFLKNKTRKYKKDNNALFLTFYGYRMSQFTINKIVKRAYRKAELDENVYTVHTLRHTCATLLYRSGVNIKTIQELLGHVHIDTTEIYTHLDNQEVKDVMFEHPLAQFKMEDALAYCA
ncbi:MAG: tyrosine-type recombinase/integrase [Clostridia bacterium]